MLRRIFKISAQQCSLLKNMPQFPLINPLKVTNFTTRYFSSYEIEKNLTKKEEELTESEDETVEIIDDAEDVHKPAAEKRAQQSKDIVFIENCSIIKVDDKNLIKSSYGSFELRGSLIPPQKVEKIKTLYYVNDTVSINYIRKVLKADMDALVVFDPTTHYLNMHAVYNGYKKKLYAQFYGTSKKPRNPYKNCKTNAEIFNLSRRIKMQIKSFLTRLCFIVDYEANLRVKGENIPYSETLNNILKSGDLSKKESDDTKIGFYRHNYFIPVGYWQGLHSSDEWEKAGIKVECLSDKKIYPLYSVWAPTSQNYLNLLSEYLEGKKNMVKARKNILDIGCGTGILSFLVVQKTGSDNVYGIDFNPKAVECTAMNAQILDMNDSVKTGVLDVVESVKKGTSEKQLKELKFPLKYELMIANPPWVTASILNSEHKLDNAIYDPKETYLKAIFAFASKHLTTHSNIAKNGILLLYYSDLSQILGLQSRDRIEELCKEYNLVINDVETTKFIDDYEVGGFENDPLGNFKNQSKVILYEITRA